MTQNRSRLLMIRPKNIDPAVHISLPEVRNAEVNRRPVTVPYDETQLKGMFMRFDTNHDGHLSKEELRNAFKSLGSRAPGFRAFCALFRADRNCNGYIDDEEFDVLVKYAMQCGYSVK